MILNSLLLLVLYFDPLNKFRTPGTILVTNLAITDGLTGIFILLRMGFALKGHYHFNGAVKLFYFSTLCTMECSLFTVLFIAWERLFAVAFPIRFKVHVTKTRTFLLSLSSWILSPILLNLSVITGDHSGRVAFTTFPILNVLVIVLILAGYCSIYKILKRKEINMGLYGAPCGTPGNHTQLIKRKSMIENKRLTNTFLFITIILLITILPMIILSSIAIMCSEECAGKALEIYFRLEPWTLLNFNVNPLVYAFQLPTYRQAFLTVFRCRNKPSEVHPEVIELH